MILSNKPITKALIRLRGCAGWFAPLLFANHQRQVFSRRCLILIMVNSDISLLEDSVDPDQLDSNCFHSNMFVLFVLSQPFFTHVGMGLPGLN